jgi:hypothetical protein
VQNGKSHIEAHPIFDVQLPAALHLDNKALTNRIDTVDVVNPCALTGQRRQLLAGDIL